MHLIIFFQEQRKIYIGGSISLAKHLDIWAKTTSWAMVPRWYFGKNIWLGAMLFRSQQKDCGSFKVRMLLEATVLKKTPVHLELFWIYSNLNWPFTCS